MIYKVEQSLSDFEFWGQARDVAREFTDEQLDQLENILSDLGWDDYPTDTAINDLFAYDSDYLKSLLGWKQTSSGEYINPDDVPEPDDEATAENIDLILDLAGVERATRRELGRIADDVNTAQWNNAEDHPDLENYHPLSIEDFIDALEAVEDNGGIDEIRETASFYISDQAVRILLSAYGLLWDSGIDLDEVKRVIYD